jgi:transposase
MRQRYPSDISREQFGLIVPILERAQKKTRPRRVDLYEVFCGVLYVLKSACQWRMLPHEYPKWRTCYSYLVTPQHPMTF